MPSDPNILLEQRQQTPLSITKLKPSPAGSKTKLPTWARPVSLMIKRGRICTIVSRVVCALFSKSPHSHVMHDLVLGHRWYHQDPQVRCRSAGQLYFTTGLRAGHVSS